MKYVEEKKESVNRIELKPCVKCGHDDIDIWNCGYSSFNVAGGTCKECKNEIKINNCSWNITQADIAREWNKANDPVILKAEYERQISELQKKIDELPQ